MARKEFTKKTQREAFARSGFKCEATGAMYGLAAGQRCNAELSYGVEYDHIVLDANSKDNSLENCAAVCIKCHKWKTANHDIPMAAKTVRQQDKARGIKTKPAKPLQGAGFPKSHKPKKAVVYRPCTFYREEQA
jgi:5-methylcytosine-specific restriction endonuclease McrA